MDVANEAVGQRVDHVGEALGTLLSEAQAAAAELDQALALRERVRGRPVVTLLGAAAVGYVLAGDLFTPLTARLLRGGISGAAARPGRAPGAA
ncbi:MAG: hypothetical protein FJ086_15870 [Deltaproteobacteria bacterium]|nr:hypothetical protein [Deltaproteobacteria bacterium]